MERIFHSSRTAYIHVTQETRLNTPTLKDSLMLGFCAALILVTKSGLRLHLGIPGHAMFFTAFFLMLSRAAVDYRLSASFTGFAAGVMAMMFGLGKGGPLILTKFVLPGMVIDLAAMALPGMFTSFALCAAVAAAASLTKFASNFVIDTMVGMDREVLMQHATLQSAGAVIFGVAGGLLVPPVVKKLRARGVI